MNKPNMCVLKTDGINCDMETAYALEVGGADTETIHVTELRSGVRSLGEFQGLALPGGFSYGDDIASGRVLANELISDSRIAEGLRVFTELGKPIIGICNGFQVLVKSGILPSGEVGGNQTATLEWNKTGRFNCSWIELLVGETVCEYVEKTDQTIPMQRANAEGRFETDPKFANDLIENGQVPFYYARRDGEGRAVSQKDDPSGSLSAIAGLCSPDGRILGMMPHPERSITAFHPDRRQTLWAREAACQIFENIVNKAQEV